MYIQNKERQQAWFFQRRRGKRKKEDAGAVSAGLPSKVHVLSPLENITHEQSTQLHGKRLFKCNVQQTNSHLFFDKLSVQGWVALGFLHLVLLLGAFGCLRTFWAWFFFWLSRILF